jgi:hypothetical protein
VLCKSQIHCVSEKRLYPVFDQRDFANSVEEDGRYFEEEEEETEAS